MQDKYFGGFYDTFTNQSQNLALNRFTKNERH